MNKLYLHIVSVLIFSINASAQSGTFAKVYTTLQTTCSYTYCHSRGASAGFLDLEGVGNTEMEKMNSVYNNLYNKVPKNAFALGKGYKLVSPGDPYSSFLFRKAHGKLKGADLVLHPDEGNEMPNGGIPLEEKDAELIRQWILYGAPLNGDVVDTAIIGKYYREGGIVSANNPPAAPDSAKGFQIHVGPFFLAPGKETEFFTKYDTRLKTNIEVNKIDAYMGTGYSHHFIVFRYNDDEKNAKPWGLRKDNAHVNTTMVSAHQKSETIALPGGTAFAWTKGSYLDLNTHYINYSTTKILAAEVHANIYTQTAGTAKQLMHSDLIANTSIYIPNDNKEHTFTDIFTTQNVYLWNISSHTHKYGKDYDLYMVDPITNKLADQLFEGSCKEGKPGCISTNYDYQHPPTRVFYPFYPIKSANNSTKMAHVAKYVNNGTKPVGFGPTSDDEMMVLLVMYVTDTAGLGEANVGINNIGKAGKNLSIKAYPNPFTNETNITFLAENRSNYSLIITDITGKILLENNGYVSAGENHINISTQQLSNGIYFYKLTLDNGSAASGKLNKL